jgi:erythromycin esterase-like protein
MLIQMSRWLLTFSLLLGAHLAPAQARLNLGLEGGANRGQPLVLWARQTFPGTTLSFDTVTFQQGRSSLRLHLEKADDPPYAHIYTLFSFPVDSVRGRVLTVSAWVRSSGFAGRAGVYAYAHTPTEDGKDRTDNMPDLPPNQAWRRLEVTLPVKNTATAFGLGLRVSGSGQVWFDDVQVRIGGRLFRDAPQPGTEALLLTPDELQTPNWDFERLPPAAANPDPTRTILHLDSLTPQHGRRSLRITNRRPGAEQAPVVYLGTLQVEKLRGKMLAVNGFWRQAASAEGAAPGSVARPVFTYTKLGNDGREGSPPQWSAGVVELPALPPPGPDWTPFAFTIPIPDDDFLTGISFGLRPGSGPPLLLDNFRFSLDGRPYVPAPPLVAAAPTTAEVAWLRKAVVPVSAVAPAINAPAKTPDLASLSQIVGNAQVVGLGEVTHGSGSIFQMKHRLVRYLVEQKGFTGFVLETSADCAPLNAWLQTGQGDPAPLLRSLGVWNTQEVLDLLRYLRHYNQQHPLKVQFAGMDMQRPEPVLARLQQASDPQDEFTQAHLRALGVALAQLPASGGLPVDLFLHPNQPDDARLQTVLHLLNELHVGLDTRYKLVRNSDLSPRQQAAFLHDLRLLEQSATFRCLPAGRAGDYRDACMAENIAWLSQSLGSNGTVAKLAVWAHNAHVANTLRGQRPMGEWLKASLGSGYLALGMAFGQGSYAAEGPSSFYEAAAQPAPAGAYEAWFQASRLPAFVLDMRPLELHDANAWLFQQQLFRDIGIKEAPRNFVQHELHSEFDAVLFIRSSTAARHLK